MIDLNSAECIVKAAARCRDVMLSRIAEDPTSPIAFELQLIASHAQYIIDTNERRQQ